MKVIAGRFKGQNLCSFKANFIRPMTDRVKTSLFDTLGPNFKNSFPFVLDLFSGTGSLAIESISRGAYRTLCIDINKKSLEIIKKNQEKLKIKEDLSCRKQDVFAFLTGYTGPAFDLILADPPFPKKWADRILHHVMRSKVIKNKTILVIEASSQENTPEPAIDLLFAKKEFGDKRLLFYQFHLPRNNNDENI